LFEISSEKNQIKAIFSVRQIVYVHRLGTSRHKLFTTIPTTITTTTTTTAENFRMLNRLMHQLLTFFFTVSQGKFMFSRLKKIVIELQPGWGQDGFIAFFCTSTAYFSKYIAYFLPYITERICIFMDTKKMPTRFIGHG
jgi:hypothetical protein